MESLRVIIIQRYFYSFREGVFDCLSQMGLKFKLLCSTRSRGRVKVHSDKVASVNYIEKCTNFNVSDSVVVFPFLFWKLLKERPNVIVTEGGQNTINNIQVMCYCCLFHTPFIQWDLGRGYQDFGNSIGRRFYMRLYKVILRQSKLVYGYNSSSKKYFVHLGIPSEKIVVLNNTVDTLILKKVINNSSKDLPQDMAKFYDPSKKYIIFVGSLLPTKRIEDFKEIMNKLKGNYTLLIVGSGKENYTQKLKQLFSDIDCVFLGYKKPEELLPYYNIASFCILPGLGGLSINQAMAYGVPVLCTHADGAEEDVVKNDVTGYLYKDIDDAVCYIHTKTEDDWKRMGKNASDLMFGDFSMERECERFIDGIRRVANGF